MFFVNTVYDAEIEIYIPVYTSKSRTESNADALEYFYYEWNNV